MPGEPFIYSSREGDLIAEHKAKGAQASVVALEVPLQEVQNYGMVVADEDGRIRSFQEKPKPEDAKSTLASTGIYIFEPEILEKVPKGKVYDIGSELFPQLAQDGSPFYKIEDVLAAEDRIRASELALFTGLRERTGAGMMDCKKALEENNGDMEQAVDILRAAPDKAVFYCYALDDGGRLAGVVPVRKLLTAAPAAFVPSATCVPFV